MLDAKQSESSSAFRLSGLQTGRTKCCEPHLYSGLVKNGV